MAGTLLHSYPYTLTLLYSYLFLRVDNYTPELTANLVSNAFYGYDQGYVNDVAMPAKKAKEPETNSDPTGETVSAARVAPSSAAAPSGGEGKPSVGDVLLPPSPVVSVHAKRKRKRKGSELSLEKEEDSPKDIETPDFIEIGHR